MKVSVCYCVLCKRKQARNQLPLLIFDLTGRIESIDGGRDGRSITYCPVLSSNEALR